VPVGSFPTGVAVDPAGTRVYVTDGVSNTVSVIATATNTVVATVPVGSIPIGVAVDPAGSRVYVANNNVFSGVSSTVSVIDTATNTVVATVPVGRGPSGVAVNPAGSRVYVANSASDTVSVIDTATNTVVATVPVGRGPAALGLFIGPGIVTPVPTLSQWGMVLLALSLLTLATWQLAGRPTLLRAATSSGLVMWAPSTNLIRSVFVGQVVAGLGLVLYGRLIEALAAHDVIGAVLSGVIIGVLLECYRQGRNG
jgi:YVTN family beta-propeller protein